jgi:hypothetical protein
LHLIHTRISIVYKFGITLNLFEKVSSK